MSYGQSRLTIVNDLISDASVLKSIFLASAGTCLTAAGITNYCAASSAYLSANPGYDPTTSGVPYSDPTLSTAIKD